VTEELRFDSRQGQDNSSHLCNVRTNSGVYQASYTVGTRGDFLGGKPEVA
jgi:hypothetical protein